jgi:hypothetical protein
MDEPNLGELITGEAGRDAVHIAIIPAIASGRLAPGTRVGLKGPDKRASAGALKPIGIVDPYLQGPVFDGEKFWLFLLPRTITSLRHVWTHPDLPVEAARGEPAVDSTGVDVSQRWIEDYALRLGLDYQQLMDGADDWVRRGEYLCEGGLLEGSYTSDEFWDHYQIVTGKHVNESEKTNFFTCSC